MFAIFLKESPPADPRKLWENHCDNLSDDCLRRLQRRRPHLILTNEQLHNYALSVLATVLNQMDRSLEDVGMPEVNSLMWKIVESVFKTWIDWRKWLLSVVLTGSA